MPKSAGAETSVLRLGPVPETFDQPGTLYERTSRLRDVDLRLEQDLQRMYEDCQSGVATLIAVIEQQRDDFDALLDNLTADDDSDE